MVGSFVVVILALLVPMEGESGVSRIPPAFPQSPPLSSGTPSVSGDYPTAMPTSRTTLPPIKPYEPSRNTSGSADWLLERMAETDSPELRSRAAEAWPVSEADAEGLREIIRHLADSSALVRTGAKQRLSEQDRALVFAYTMRTMVGGSLEDVKALDAALPFLGDTIGYHMMETLRTELEAPQHRRIAAYCLGRMGIQSAAEVLEPNVWAQDTALAQACLDALALLLPPGSAPCWIKLLEHPEPRFRTQAVRALAALGDPKSFDTLKGILFTSGYGELQGEVLRSLQNYPPEILYPLLVEVMERTLEMRSAAVRILRKRTGLDWGPRPEPWRQWLHSLTTPPAPPLVPSP